VFNGLVGIGTSSPYAKVSITNTGTAPSFIVEDTTSPDNSPFIIDASGNVGIGAALLTGKLNVEGGALYNNNGNTVAGTTFFNKRTALFDTGDTGTVGVNIMGRTGQTADFFQIGSTTQVGDVFTVKASGNVGIGATAPTAKFQVNTSAIVIAPTMTALINSTASTSFDTLVLANNGFTADTSLRGAGISFKSTTFGNTSGYSSGRLVSYFDTSSGANPGYSSGIIALQYPTADNTFTTGLALRNGLVGIGTTSPYAKLSVVGQIVAAYFTATSTTATSTFAGGTIFNGKVGIATSSPSGVLSVQGSVFLNGLTSSTAGNAVCQLTGGEIVNAGNTTCLTSSKRFKTDIKDIDVGLKEVLAMKPRSYTRTQPTPSMPTGKEVGLIAEEVNEIVPRLVEYEADGVTPRGVNYQEYTAVLTKAIQEQQKQIDELKAMQGGMPQSESKKYQVILTMILVAGSAFLIGKLTNTLKK
jgi:hypothetical protein